MSSDISCQYPRVLINKLIFVANTTNTEIILAAKKKKKKMGQTRRWCHLLLMLMGLSKLAHVSCNNFKEPGSKVHSKNESHAISSKRMKVDTSHGGYIPPFNVTQNKPRVFLRRMRKAGSTTVGEYIMAALNVYAKALNKNIEDVIIYDHMEYPGLNVQCIFGPNPILMLPKTVLITHFRNPLSRINSEYWYAINVPTLPLISPLSSSPLFLPTLTHKSLFFFLRFFSS
jgi:hypothetical protein